MFFMIYLLIDWQQQQQQQYIIMQDILLYIKWFQDINKKYINIKNEYT